MSRPEVTDKKFIGKRAVAERYTIAPRTVDRWVLAKVLPEPDFHIQHRPYWEIDRLDQHDRQRVIEHGRARTRSHAAAPSAS